MMTMETPIFTDDLEAALTMTADSLQPDRIYMLTDSNVARCAESFAPSLLKNPRRRVITIPAGEENKNIDTLSYIWKELAGASRSSLLCCLGGGMVCDVGGFAAATFKRGIPHINIPTTLLACCDAAIGGKTGIDFNGAKNEVGAFAMPRAVIISSIPLSTLPQAEILSGMGEMVKTALIADRQLYCRMLNAASMTDDITGLADMAKKCADIKCSIVRQDPDEQNLRRILNLGHTAGHAFETFMLEKGTPVSHGAAVAHGILVALILSHMKVNMPSQHIYSYASEFLKPLYPFIPFTCDDYPRLISTMMRDKKNRADSLARFVLLSDIGMPVQSVAVNPKEIETALDIYRDIIS